MSRPPIPIDQRFWPKVKKRGPDDCWLWTARKGTHGYGMISSPGHGMLFAHRVCFAIHNGPIPSGLVVLHSCDTPACVNPAHLRLGTQGDNLRDMSAKGRNVNSKKTHCKNGHELSAANTYTQGGRRRQCRTCNAAAVARRKHRMAA